MTKTFTISLSDENYSSILEEELPLFSANAGEYEVVIKGYLVNVTGPCSPVQIDATIIKFEDHLVDDSGGEDIGPEIALTWPSLPLNTVNNIYDMAWPPSLPEIEQVSDPIRFTIGGRGRLLKVKLTSSSTFDSSNFSVSVTLSFTEVASG